MSFDRGFAGVNRPYKWGSHDRREFITYDSEMAIRCQNDENGNPIYIGRAKPGTDEDAPKWQISYHTYDGLQALTSKQWPVNDINAVSTEYEFAWSDRESLTYV